MRNDLCNHLFSIFLSIDPCLSYVYICQNFSKQFVGYLIIHKKCHCNHRTFIYNNHLKINLFWITLTH